MRPAYAASFAAALICHALLLFGFKPGTPARPLPVSNEPSSVDVSLVASAPENPPAESTPLPEPVPTPEPVSTPPPEPAQTPLPEVAPAPEPPRETPAPQSHAPKNTGKTASSAPLPAAQNGAHQGGASTSGPVTTGVRYRSNPKPEYPGQARRLHQEGVVLLSVEVSAGGDPVSVSLKRSSGFDLLDQSAIRAVKRWTFEPARVGAFPVPTRVDVPVRFVLSE